ncbi:Similar to B1: Esterase B1 (Culex pipiens) [Cotesia congregata]|uniref:Carboxylic ester hydrolase n=1 Tax=Cotesia congregata TaxID=51543 RepID=A0A8J2HEE1_COTCN|nr:Similar to B1: Esterase B1 (Culex pipiens) [Cotesia congregata]
MKKRAVIVWIYGGGFVSGSSNPKTYGPDFLIEEDVVVVAMNYRLGALGFLSLKHTNATGNAGLKDQKMALEWVQKEIESFGGDPKKVTVFGQSAGSASALFQVLSEASSGLFRSAIAMTFGRSLGVDTTDPEVLLKKLYSSSAGELVLAMTKTTNVFVPYLLLTLEDPKAESPFLTQCSVDKLKTNNFNQVSVMLGFTSLETLFYIGNNKLARDEIIGGALEIVKNISELQNTEQVKFFQEMQTFSKNNETFSNDEIYKMCNITTDMLYYNGIDLTRQLLASKIPVYFYRNSFDYPQALHRVMGININGTGHSDDVLHIFWASNFNQPLDPKSDIGIQRMRMVKMWTNFAKYGDPTPGDLDPVLNIKWPLTDSEGQPVDDFVRYLQHVMEPLLGKENGCQ